MLKSSVKMKKSWVSCDRNSRSDAVHVDSGLDKSFHFIQALKPGFSVIFTVQIDVKVFFYSWSMV